MISAEVGLISPPLLLNSRELPMTSDAQSTGTAARAADDDWRGRHRFEDGMATSSRQRELAFLGTPSAECTPLSAPARYDYHHDALAT